MRKNKNNGVYVSSHDVYNFASQFPCANMVGETKYTRWYYRFYFEFANNGDLIDLKIWLNRKYVNIDDTHIDGYALLCLSQDAYNYLVNKR